MNVVNPENKAPETIVQDKVEATSLQQNVDVTLPQNGQVTHQNTEKNVQQVNENPDWKAFREARKKDRAEKEAAEKRAKEKEAEAESLKAALEAAFSKQSPSPDAYQHYYGLNPVYDQPEESQEQLIEKKVNQLLEQRERQYRQEQEERERREYPTKLSKDYPDFAHVCSQENLDYLDYHYPELSRPLQRLPEGYDKWSDIYHAVKKFIPNHSNMKKEAEKADMNSNKPKSISSTQLSPPGERVAEPWQDVERRRQANWERMQRVMKGVG